MSFPYIFTKPDNDTLISNDYYKDPHESKDPHLDYLKIIDNPVALSGQELELVVSQNSWAILDQA